MQKRRYTFNNKIGPDKPKLVSIWPEIPQDTAEIPTMSQPIASSPLILTVASEDSPLRAKYKYSVHDSGCEFRGPLLEPSGPAAPSISTMVSEDAH